MFRNQYDSNHSFELGEEAEKEFCRLAIENGFTVFPAVAYTDMHEHIDFIICKCTEREYSVDVKGMKRISRNGEPQDKQIWIELHGVNKDNEGWLYGGKAYFIAFQMEFGFYLVRRTDLIGLVEKYVHFDVIVDYPEQAQFCVYQRLGREDKLTLIPSCLLKTIWNRFWNDWQ